MKETGIIKVEKRAVAGSKANNRLREDGFMPGNISGKGVDSIAIVVKKDELRKTLAQFGKNYIYKIDMGDGQNIDVMVKEIQYTPVSREYMHVDFQKVSFSEEIKAEIQVKVVGREAVEQKRLMLLRHVDMLPVKGLPQFIPDDIEVDVSALEAGANVFASDIQLKDGLVLEVEGDHLIVSIVEAKVSAAEDETTEEETAEVE